MKRIVTYADADRLIGALEAARGRIRDDRARLALPPMAEKREVVASWETAIDPVNQVAVIRANHALKRMEPGSDLRQ